MQFVLGGKPLSSNCRNFLPMFVVACLLNGELNHVMFRFLVCLLCFMLVVLSFRGLYVRAYVYPLFCSASWYLCAAWLNVRSFEDMLDSLLFMLSGMFFMMLGGWLLSLWM